MTCECGTDHDKPLAEGAIACIIPGPKKVIATKDDQVRWCFSCRKHLPHMWVCLWDHTIEEAKALPIEKLTYYDPIWIRKCSGCGKDRTDFPGRTW